MEIKKAEKAIINAALVGAVHAGLQLIGVSLALLFQFEQLEISALSYLEALLIAGLAFGVYRKSRTCAILILIVLILGVLSNMILTNSRIILFMGVFYGFFYYEGIRGTFAYHRAKSNC